MILRPSLLSNRSSIADHITWVFLAPYLNALSSPSQCSLVFIKLKKNDAVDNIKIDLRKIGYEDVNWFEISQGHAYSQALFVALFNFQFPCQRLGFHDYIVFHINSFAHYFRFTHME
jgi:hypothetical protein